MFIINILAEKVEKSRVCALRQNPTRKEKVTTPQGGGIETGVYHCRYIEKGNCLYLHCRYFKALSQHKNPQF
jgi:hypothetical protein